jgi:hypothetical protein
MPGSFGQCRPASDNATGSDQHDQKCFAAPGKKTVYR